MIQTILCFIIVFAALIYVLHYYFVRVKKKNCGSCGSVDQKPTTISIPLSALQRRKKPERPL